MLKGKTVLLGVTGSIAAYKTASLASMLVKKGVKVQKNTGPGYEHQYVRESDITGQP